MRECTEVKKNDDKPGTRNRFPSNVSNTGGVSKRRSVLKIMSTNAHGLVGNGKELEYKDRVERNKPDIMGIAEAKLIENVK